MEVWMVEALAQQLKEFEDDVLWLERRSDKLKRKYSDEYVAVHERKVIDHDPSLERLMERLRERYPEDSDKVAVKYISRKKFEMVL